MKWNAKSQGKWKWSVFLLTTRIFKAVKSFVFFFFHYFFFVPEKDIMQNIRTNLNFLPSAAHYESLIIPGLRRTIFGCFLLFYRRCFCVYFIDVNFIFKSLLKQFILLILCRYLGNGVIFDKYYKMVRV